MGLRERLTPLDWRFGLRMAFLTLPFPVGLLWLDGWPGLPVAALHLALYVVLATVALALIMPIVAVAWPADDEPDDEEVAP